MANYGNDDDGISGCLQSERKHDHIGYHLRFVCILYDFSDHANNTEAAKISEHTSYDDAVSYTTIADLLEGPCG